MDLGVIGGYAFNLIQSEQFSELVALFYTHTNKRRIHFVHTLPAPGITRGFFFSVLATLAKAKEEEFVTVYLEFPDN